ncbi:hypothetical protein PPL_07788 [Heterostelium album PN500]|uniref:BTB domain-containing protein n=1 Tax=Heterostelium pallidum (strain ATCC 26659 / Pp 5 / PN500) TaxID=670386 RepID=D3BGY6_HETP5|nr:hypothetical protein PPL_07788 [Heterostelium album PN500]EFA79370.1 hypothetical protein PPL_07788 [Heterostelium album PN500]|eukprot:XP_020431491.1 hypothetical protein PPL_07788 [Heterostelium album PN500]
MSQIPVDIESNSSSSNSSLEYIDAASADDEPVILNVGGVKYEVRPSTLTRYPQTLLGNLFLRENKHLRRPDKKGEYFFDRNGRVFEVILNFYRTGKLVIPTEIPQELIQEELKYFKLDHDDQENQEDEDEKIMKQPRDQIFNYTNSLIHSSNKYDIKRGLYFLQKLSELEPNSYLYKYSIAFAYYRLKKNKEGVEVLEEILQTDPHNPQVRSLLTLFDDNRKYNATVGLVAVSLLIVGLFGFWRLRSWFRAAAPVVASSTSQMAVETFRATSGAAAASVPQTLAAANIVVPATVSVSNAVASTVASVLPGAATAGKVLATGLVANDSTSAILIDAATTAVTSTTPAVTSVVAESIPTATTSFLEAMNQSLPSADQFKQT